MKNKNKKKWEKKARIHGSMPLPLGHKPFAFSNMAALSSLKGLLPLAACGERS